MEALPTKSLSYHPHYMLNRLTHETSPYLRQHAHNPVDWYPWGEEALTRARAENKPILLSIGYAACHWCHVMAHESFEDGETAALMNRYFINIKVDREERPDLDSIYMNAVVAMTGQGGWPMTVALTPAGQPFFGGTYFPRLPRYGMPAFKQVLLAIQRAWESQQGDILRQAEELTSHLQRNFGLQAPAGTLTPALFNLARQQLNSNFDSHKGGFGRAPKFPQPMTIEFLLRQALAGHEQAQQMAEVTLDMMARGGIYDQLGGGFARYSTDNDWLVPHFEKMLYDNALLSRLYLHGWQLTGRPFYRQVAEETLDWAVREMRDPAGGFYSSLDADSEGQEGKFYLWQMAEINALLADEADLFNQHYGVSRFGNWEGDNILYQARTVEETAQLLGQPLEQVTNRLAAARQTLYQARTKRVWPGLDDKVLTAWNGLMLAAFAEAGRILQRPDYTAIANQNAQFLHQTMRQANGRLFRTWKAGHQARYNGYLEDYAYLADGLLALYQTTFETRWFVWATELADQIKNHFSDPAGGFFDTADDHEPLIHRPKDVQDNATPSGNAMAAQLLLQLSLFTGRNADWEQASQAIAAMEGPMSQYPTGFAQWLCAADLALSRPQEIAVVGDPAGADSQALLAVINRHYRPHQVVAAGPDGEVVPLLANRPAHNNQATAYVCRQFVCLNPVTTPAELAQQLANSK